MSEITKLYENAGLSNMWVERYNDGYYEHERYYNSYKEMINNMMKANDWTLTEAQEVAKRECRKEHPPFTAEKVLKVIVFFLNKGIKLDFSVEENTKISVENFKECIAQIGARYWQSLTSEEKQQIRGILNG